VCVCVPLGSAIIDKVIDIRGCVYVCLLCAHSNAILISEACRNNNVVAGRLGPYKCASFLMPERGRFFPDSNPCSCLDRCDCMSTEEVFCLC
jgi:hypothetical protein